ncbi:phage tail protein [Leptolyngbya cf. ectocarpi LEGE 11479]|uniref:Phage tail protein n=1 Tax=Leptolyngbya cf. ectocarpi LEGE 11479 TaxID=1828722 RepID=A0A928ZZE0_LEPEC|nr:phage tail protein [Leptolyngbya ectocarpi]MBE9070275.1 phage tail protein [Leptolyngbya cf. ectocarpi LEGE 11479]
MSKVQTGQLMSLELMPLQVPEATTESALVFSRQAVIPQSLQAKLRLQPGEFSELVVRLKNHSDEPLQLQFSVTGDIPAGWWQLRTEGSVLPGRHQMEAVVYFAIAPDFFERTVAPEQLPLKLDYTGQLSVTAFTARGHSQEHISSFQLLVRPPSLYLNFLPDIYRNVDFVGRLLKIFETAFEPTVDILDQQWAYLDPLTAPQAMLPFLAHWVGWSFQGPLSLAQQRALIRYAMEIYRWRGTRRGLRFYLHLASGLPLDDHIPDESQKSIGIHESFSQGHVLGHTVMGQSTILSGNIPYHFNVHLRPTADHPLDETLIHTIIEQEKPAFCSYNLSIEPRV